ncbi:hypothetical protein T552_00834 [Pneumocystis carinii B80]|uniref:Gem-associated protein 2 n=1 Tax=Pneumocystis carinii (strain B80) TaxID=1408658 RepID=A0A0W4ZPS0_PNEC8|nr:hypothetical protein T552_00834 [Pneumocystis carinii B80]KTW30361.1 hypothetical protein T552_00834 [Pneumocystis carinii B80]
MRKKGKKTVKNESKMSILGPVDIETKQRGVFPELMELNESSESEDSLPLDGVSYLKKVRIEAKNRPVIKAVEAPSNGTGRIQVSEPKISNKTDEIYSSIWEEKFLEKFIKLRKKFDLQENLEMKSLPEDKIEWRRLIMEEMKPPTILILKSINQCIALNLLKWNTEWISSNSHEQQIMWIFYLLVKIDKVMTSEELSILRELCKKCLFIRNTKKNLPLYIQSNIDMVISIVGNIFGQKDLLLSKL